VSGLNFPVRLDVFESRMFWVSEQRGMLSTMDKFGRGVNRTLQTGLVRPHAIRLFHPNEHDIASTNTDDDDADDADDDDKSLIMVASAGGNDGSGGDGNDGAFVLYMYVT